MTIECVKKIDKKIIRRDIKIMFSSGGSFEGEASQCCEERSAVDDIRTQRDDNKN
jgi:hypothetical protein